MGLPGVIITITLAIRNRADLIIHIRIILKRIFLQSERVLDLKFCFGSTSLLTLTGQFNSRREHIIIRPHMVIILFLRDILDLEQVLE
jgi:hypothetical protein